MSEEDMDFRRTMPWSEDEMIFVNGRPLVYSMSKLSAEPLVHMPGGTSATPSQLRAQGHEVILPRRWRFESTGPSWAPPGAGDSGPTLSPVHGVATSSTGPHAAPE